MKKNARTLALNALERCRRSGTYSGAAIDAILSSSACDERDAALASKLCLGVLQNFSLCDYYISVYCRAKKLEPKVRDILRMGIYEILFLDRIPSRASVNEGVNLCKAHGYKSAAGMVNAVLRRVAENKNSLPPIPDEGSGEHLSIKYSHNKWLAQRLIDEKGYAFTEEFFKANNAPAGLTIQVNTLKISVEDYAALLDAAGLSYKLYDFPLGCIELEGGSVKALPGFDDGLFYVQDRAARLSVEFAEPLPGMKVLDACSAPGGKAFACAVKMGNKGAITAWDIHPKKIGLINDGAKRLGIDIIEAKENDARTIPDEYACAFDLVIADVPCSGLGVIRKKPEIRNKSYEEISPLPSVQADILNNLSKCVKVGGIIIYSTCTILREENDDIVRAFLTEHENFKFEDFRHGDIQSKDGMYTFWPNRDNTDGFFAAKMRRMF